MSHHTAEWPHKFRPHKISTWVPSRSKKHEAFQFPREKKLTAELCYKIIIGRIDKACFIVFFHYVIQLIETCNYRMANSCCPVGLRANCL